MWLRYNSHESDSPICGTDSLVLRDCGKSDYASERGSIRFLSSGRSYQARSRPIFDELAKRIFDVLFALTLILVTLPFLVLLSIALQIDSPGRLLFIQHRVGRDGKMFPCIKFRTMREDAAAVLQELLANSPEARAEWAADHKLRNDPRVSRLGRIVRKLSLDELPQLINILLGHMSVVGPRPIVRAEVEKYAQHFEDYCSVRPGLTGLWQVSGRNETSYQVRVLLDRHYARNCTFAMDMSIVFRTIPVVLGAKGAY